MAFRDRELAFDPDCRGGGLAVRRVYYSAASKSWLAARARPWSSARPNRRQSPASAKVAPFIVVFVAEIIIGLGAVRHPGAHERIHAARRRHFGRAVWFGFVVTTMTSNYAFHGRKAMLTVIDSVAWLGALVIIGAIVGWMGR